LEAEEMRISSQIQKKKFPEIKAFIRRKKITERSPKTYLEYERFLFKFFREETSKSPLEITEADLEDYLEKLQGSAVERNTIKKYLDILSSFFKFLSDREEYDIKYNPARTLAEEIRTERKERPLCATWQNGRKVVFAMRDVRDFCLCVILIKTGIRINEALEIKVGDVKEDGWIYLPRRKGGKKKAGYVPVDDEVLKAVDKLMLHRPKDSGCDYLFISLKGGRLSRPQAGKIIKRAAIMVGVSERSNDFHNKFTPHTFRSVFTTVMKNNRCRIDVLKKIRGDALNDMVDLYTNLTREQVKEEYLRCIPRLGI
jgi:integrase/recombinase XerD